MCQPPHYSKETYLSSKNIYALLRAGFSSDLVNQCLNEKKLQEEYKEFRGKVREDTEKFLNKFVEEERNYMNQLKADNEFYKARDSINEFFSMETDCLTSESNSSVGLNHYLAYKASVDSEIAVGEKDEAPEAIDKILNLALEDFSKNT